MRLRGCVRLLFVPSRWHVERTPVWCPRELSPAELWQAIDHHFQLRASAALGTAISVCGVDVLVFCSHFPNPSGIFFPTRTATHRVLLRSLCFVTKSTPLGVRPPSQEIALTSRYPFLTTNLLLHVSKTSSSYLAGKRPSCPPPRAPHTRNCAMVGVGCQDHEFCG